jgi:hypothetical protein
MPRRSRTTAERAGIPTDPDAWAPSPGPAAATTLLDPPTDPAGPEVLAEPAIRPRRRRGSTPRPPRPPAPRHRLLLACTAVLAAGLFGVLLLNTIISQGAFRQHELEVALILLSEEEEALARDVQQAEAPIEVERKARALGMVPAGAPVFLRLSDGRILGEPVPAPRPTGPVDFTDAPGLLPPGAARSGDEAGASTGTAADPLVDPALDPATGLDATPTPTPTPQPSPTAGADPTQVGDGATPGPAPGAATPRPAGQARPGAIEPGEAP